LLPPRRAIHVSETRLDLGRVLSWLTFVVYPSQTMLLILGCITVDHDLGLVVLAGAICLFASVTAIELLSRARSTRNRSQLLWIAATGAVAGCGVWTTHFVAMLAYRSSLPITYDVALTSLSVLAAVVLASAGVWIAVKMRAGLAGGAVVGIAVGAMHYIGMAALRGPIEASWDASYVAASLIVGPVLSAFAFAVALRASTLPGRIQAAGLLTLGIIALHFTGMTGLTLTPIVDAAATENVLAPTSIAVAVAAVALLITGLGLTGTLVDRHLGERAEAEAARLRAYIVELEATKENLEATSGDLMTALAAAAQGSQAKSQFLAAMSHELRTPLNAVIGYSELIRMQPYGPVGDARYLEYVGDIHASGSHLLSLINDVLDLARLDANRVELDEEAVDLADLIDEALRSLTPQASVGQLQLSRSTLPSVLQVCADRRRLKQVLLNLLSNAVKFTPAGGRVGVAVKLDVDGLVIAITDTGIGIASGDIPKALERFGQIDSRLARKYEGTGLGLPLAKQLAELHGGSLVIASEPGRGTTVGVRLPAARVLQGAVAA
jgi:signal transduction histidine kinase